MVGNKGYKTRHIPLVTYQSKLTSSCVMLHCTNYPRPLRASLVGSQVLRLWRRWWFCRNCWI